MHVVDSSLMCLCTHLILSIVCLQDFSGCQVVADIGGGYGELVMEIMELAPSERLYLFSTRGQGERWFG